MIRTILSWLDVRVLNKVPSAKDHKDKIGGILGTIVVYSWKLTQEVITVIGQSCQ